MGILRRVQTLTGLWKSCSPDAGCAYLPAAILICYDPARVRLWARHTSPFHKVPMCQAITGRQHLRVLQPLHWGMYIPVSGVDKRLTLTKRWPLFTISIQGMDKCYLKLCKVHMSNSLSLDPDPHWEWMSAVVMGDGRKRDAG